MGKRYYCEYCDKSMVSSPHVIKTHIRGLFHEQMVKQHYHQFKDIETVLQEERAKKPCAKFPNCSFGFKCRFSHYTHQELENMRNILSQQKPNSNKKQPSFTDLYKKIIDSRSMEPQGVEGTVLKDENGLITILPWTYPSNYANLPKSLLPLSISDFENCEFAEWG